MCKVTIRSSIQVVLRISTVQLMEPSKTTTRLLSYREHPMQSHKTQAGALFRTAVVVLGRIKEFTAQVVADI